MSLMATFPQFYQVEQENGSIVLGMKKLVPSKKPSNSQTPSKGIFQTLTNGLQSIVERIEEELPQKDVLKGMKVLEVRKVDSSYECLLNNGHILEADKVIVAIPHQHLPGMFNQHSIFEPLKTVPSTSVANVAMAFPESAIKKDIEGTGFVVSRNSDYTITACTWTHKKWPHACPKGKVLLRCYVGRPDDQDICDKTDEELVNIVLKDLKKTMSITEQPEFFVVSRWKEAMPQYTINHLDRTKAIQSYLKEEMPGVTIVGSSFYGAGLPDCIDQGEKAVEETLDFLFKKNNEEVAIIH
jgi:oxygen-dependent protoporphyrinogen oxidase